jgi:CRP-like cAMP-binding protein
MASDLNQYINNLKQTTREKESAESKLQMAETIKESLTKFVADVLGYFKVEYSFDWMVPYMKKMEFKKGEIVLRKGDVADKLYYIKNGLLRLKELDKIFEPGTVFGEIGLFSPYKERTLTIVCEEDSEIFVLTEEEVSELFYTKPSLIFELINISIKRSINNFKETISKQERIKSELKMASEIQISMLPRQFPASTEKEAFDIYAMMEPAKEVGDDFYDFFLIDDNRLYITIADVSGKGIPAALFMVITKILLKTEALHGFSPSEIITRVNQILYPDNDTCMFATVFCAILDLKTGILKYSNAGHNPPLFYHAANGGFEFLDLPKGCVVGAMPDNVFKEKEITMKSGDILFLYTDGVTEAKNNKDNQY